MRNLFRPFAVLISLGWIAAWAGAIWLMWNPGLEGRIDLTDFNGVADITTGGWARLFATVISGAAIVLALPVLLGAFTPAKTRAVEPAVDRDHDRERDHAHPGMRPTEAAGSPRIHAVVPADDAHDRVETPASLRSATAPVAEPRTEPMATPVTATADDPDEMAVLRARLDRQDEEIRRLRDMVTRRDTAITTEPERVSNGRP